jgi:8-oxo-dGTP pyrophosphatase MutT (NUDIX family)
VAEVTRPPAERSALRRLIEERLSDSHPTLDINAALLGGVPPDAAYLVRDFYPKAPIAAAVLIPIVDHSSGLTVLLTQRSSHLKNHAGQISFPGGRLEKGETPLQAAMREAQEEIGLAADYIEVVGYLEPQLIISGFWVTPIVAFVRPGFDLSLDPNEVDDTFEIPLSYILDETNHQSRERRIGEAAVQVYDIPFGERRIWGATAGMLMTLHKLLAHDPSL